MIEIETMKLFELIYVLRDSSLIRILQSDTVIYNGDVFTYRTYGMTYSCLHRTVLSLDVIPDLNCPILLIKIN